MKNAPKYMAHQATLKCLLVRVLILGLLSAGSSLFAQVSIDTNPYQPSIGPIIQNPPIENSTTNQPQKDVPTAQREEQQADARDELQLDSPTLSKMNQSATTTERNSSQVPGGNGLLEISGGYSDNLYNRSTDKIGSSFIRYAIPLTFTRAGGRIRFSSSYLPQFTSYSQAKGVYQSHLYQHTMLYDLSARMMLSWQLTAAHYRDVGQFLPVVLPIGGTSIAQPTGDSSNDAGSSSVSNMATSVALLHHLTEKDRITYTATAAWSELLQITSINNETHQILRSQPIAGDALYEHSVSSATSIGIEETIAHVRGLSNSTSLTYDTLLGTVRYLVTPNDRFSFGAGPLILHTAGDLTPNTASANTTYAINTLYSHQSSIATIDGGYSRIIQLNLDNSSSVAHQLFGDFMKPIGSRIFISAGIRYIHASSPNPNLQQTNWGGSARLDYRTGTRLSWFVNASQNNSSFPTNGTIPSSFSRGEISGGLRLAFRNSFSER